MHLVLRPENPCQTWDPRAKFRVLYRIELKDGGSAVRAPDLGPTSGKCQCAGQGVSSNAYERCNPRCNFEFYKTRESRVKFGPRVPNLTRVLYRVLEPNAPGLHLVGVRGHTLTSTLALPASWAEVGGSNGGPTNFEFYTI